MFVAGNSTGQPATLTWRWSSRIERSPDTQGSASPARAASNNQPAALAAGLMVVCYSSKQVFRLAGGAD